MKHKRLRFSLVELLIVISIMAILMSLLIPSLGRLHFQTKLTSCAVNLKNIGNGVMMYAEDYNETYPVNTLKRDRTFHLASGGSRSIYEQIIPYFGDVSKTFMCEGARENTTWETSNRAHESVENTSSNSDNGDTISAAYHMYFSVDESHNGVWYLNENQMRKLGDMFTIRPWQGHSGELASFNFLASDLNTNNGSSHIPEWEFRQHRSIGGHYAASPNNQRPAFGWGGYEHKNNYLSDDGGVFLHEFYMPPYYYHNGWGQRGYIHKNFYVTNYNNGDEHLDIPRELIKESNL
jgi:competence protein ComGC